MDALVFGWDRSNVGPVEVWLRRRQVGQTCIGVEQESALAAANGGMWGWLQQQRLTHCKTRMPPSPSPDLSGAFVSPGASEPRRPASAAVAAWCPRRWPGDVGHNASYAGERRERPASLIREAPSPGYKMNIDLSIMVATCGGAPAAIIGGAIGAGVRRHNWTDATASR